MDDPYLHFQVKTHTLILNCLYAFALREKETNIVSPTMYHLHFTLLNSLNFPSTRSLALELNYFQHHGVGTGL